ncbi:hypothetical protein LZK98_10355 [Sphingomonas cannabina]|uniref:hypothetical protein n=1 Tax=Sphingomonas cannabina TaxID=2899123 RepID=UPI001F43A7FC|nr:hypothetical protein [Sphingomonas cannabina]UIJ43506.1 hypothetical protein LZK98_10355 [Sphingomonas cannabina]
MSARTSNGTPCHYFGRCQHGRVDAGRHWSLNVEGRNFTDKHSTSTAAIARTTDASSASRGGVKRDIYVSPRGKVLGGRDPETRITETVARIHGSLLLGSWGIGWSNWPPVERSS